MTNLVDFYDKDSDRFWDPIDGPIGRDIHLLKLSQEIKYRSVLEYGPGSGSLLFSLLKNKKNCQIIAYDISKKIIEKLNINMNKMLDNNMIDKTNKGSFYLVDNDLLDSTEDNSIDLCLCGDVLEHVIDPFRVLREFKRVLKIEGKLILSVPNYGYLRHIFKLLRGKQPITGGHASVYEWHKEEEGWDGMHLHTFTHESLLASLETTGFVVEKIVGDSKELPIPFWQI